MNISAEEELKIKRPALFLSGEKIVLWFYRRLRFIKIWCKWLLFPGLDLHTRSRYRFLPCYFLKGPCDTLDAGCGNGCLSYSAYQRGNRVHGITNDPDEVSRAKIFFTAIGTDHQRLKFRICNLYDLPSLMSQFDQIICSETLEHIKDDQIIIKHFYDILRPGGVLHLISPFALHPEHNLGRFDEPEDGGHIRDGYTLESFQALLEPQGFKIVMHAGLGTPLLVKLDNYIRMIRCRIGDWAALPLFILTLPLQMLDRINPSVPYSLYVQAVKEKQKTPSSGVFCR